MRILIFIVVSIFSVGCADSGIGEVGPQSSNDILSKEPNSSGPPSLIFSNEESGETSLSNATRHIIYDADIDIVVEDFPAFTKQLPAIVVDFGGYVADVKLRQNQDIETAESHRKGTWKIRVLAQRFDAFVVRLSEIGFVVRHNQTSKDVTAEFVDLDARIVNKKRMESRVLDIIKESNRNLSEIMKLENELSRIRGEIERLEGRLNLIKNQTQFATLTIIAVEKPSKQIASAFNDRVALAWKTSIDLVATCFQFIIVLLVAVFPWSVVLAFFSAVVWVFALIVKRIRKIWLIRGISN